MKEISHVKKLNVCGSGRRGGEVETRWGLVCFLTHGKTQANGLGKDAPVVVK